VSTTSGKPLTILHVMPDLFPLGGTPRKLVSVGPALRELGVRQAFLVIKAQPDAGMAARVRAAGGLVATLRHGGSGLGMGIAAAVRRLDADVVVTHFARADILGALGGCLAGRPVIKAIEGIRWSDRAAVVAVDGALSGLRVLVVANSYATLNAACRRGKIGDAVVVYPGVDDAGARDLSVSRAVRAELGIPPDCFVIGHIGGMIPLRRQSTLIEAAELLLRDAPQTHLRVLLVGDGPERLALEKMVEERRLRDSVHIAGYRDDALRVRHAFDAYVNPADAEGFGLATVEAMQLGIPVIAAAAGASPELITDRRTGLLVRSRDPEALAAALQTTMQDRSLAHTLGAQARAEALERFSLRRYAVDLKRAYGRAADARPATRGLACVW
jgi:glycosyltransferase involved in cell wall biosynthesis